MAQLVPCIRKISTSSLLRTSMAEPLQPAAHNPHGDSWKMWRNLFMFVCIPAMGISYLNVHLSEEPPAPEFKKYSHLRIRKKTYPWRDGVKTLFHNPHRNALPDGYEAEPH